ncbi:MAG TPA: hypothetical protein VFQ79_09140 [Bryobacteraceae bacterium]|nr:hypothetical protein [Bryobacteraceae bacterium]
MDPFALIQQLHHQLDLLTRAIHQPPGTAISVGDLVQLAPESHPVYGGYLMDVRNVSETRAGGPILATYRGAWTSIPLDRLVRVSALRAAAIARRKAHEARKA